jgi:N-acetylmuramoyl-L-alanine amidase
LAQPSGNLDHQNPDETINAGTINGKNRVYVVVAGDTLYSLSKRFGLTVDQIKEHNKLESIDLSIGQELKLPE